MTRQPGFRFHEIEAERLAPVPRPALPPINGSTPMSRHASYTGALAADASRSAHIATLRRLWREPHTMQAIAAISGLPLSSVCSLKAAIGAELVAVGFDVQVWGDGQRTTKRTKWQLRDAGR